MASLVSRPRHSIQMYWARRSYQRLGSPSRRLKVARLGDGRSVGSPAAAASSWKGIRLACRAAALLAAPVLLLARLRDAYVDAMVALGGFGVRPCAALARSHSGAEAGLWDKRVLRALRELLARIQIGHPEAKSRAMDGLLDTLRRDERSVLAALGHANVAAMVQLLTASAPVVQEKASTVRAPGSGSGAPVACLGSARRRGSPELPAAAQAAAPWAVGGAAVQQSDHDTDDSFVHQRPPHLRHRREVPERAGRGGLGDGVPRLADLHERAGATVSDDRADRRCSVSVAFSRATRLPDSASMTSGGRTPSASSRSAPGSRWRTSRLLMTAW